MYCQWCVTELRASWKVGLSFLCNVVLVWQFVNEIGMAVDFNVYRTDSTMAIAIVGIATIMASL
jgi:hypothetical protein